MLEGSLVFNRDVRALDFKPKAEKTAVAPTGLTGRLKHFAKESVGWAILGVISLVVWPILLLIGILIGSFSAFLYTKACVKQSKTLALLKSPDQLEAYGKKRYEKMDERIKFLKKFEEERLKRVKDLKKIDQPDLKPEDPDYKNVQGVLRLRTRRECLEAQKAVLDPEKGESRVEAIQSIATLRYIKDGIREESHKKGMKMAGQMMLPGGLLISLVLPVKTHYASKKEYISKIEEFKGFSSLIEAHNALTLDKPYLVPYFP